VYCVGFYDLSIVNNCWVSLLAPRDITVLSRPVPGTVISLLLLYSSTNQIETETKILPAAERRATRPRPRTVVLE
jgi:hypothetical protein